MSDSKLNHTKNKKPVERLYRLALKKGEIDFACVIPKFGGKSMVVKESELETDTNTIETMLEVYYLSEKNKADEMYNTADSLYGMIRRSQAKGQSYYYILGFDFIRKGFEKLGISNIAIESNDSDYSFEYAGKTYTDIFDIEASIYKKICDIYHKITGPKFTSFNTRYYWEEV